jgi:hypothetical protein
MSSNMEKTIMKKEKAAAAAAKKAEKAAAAAAKKAEKAEKAAAASAKKAEKVVKAVVKKEISASDITYFFKKSLREDNDAANKIRESVLAVILDPSCSSVFIADPEHGPAWIKVRDEFIKGLTHITADPTTQVKILPKAGRGYKFDFSVQFYNNDILVATEKLEFKFGASSIKGLPQFLSLPTTTDDILHGLKYHDYFYDHCLTDYLATDLAITAAKPTKEEYCKLVFKTNPSCHPLFTQMHDRKYENEAAKNAIVNKSITDYLTTHAPLVDTAAFSKKVLESQTGKHFLLWSGNTFHYDHFKSTEMTGLTYSHIKNGNALILAGSGCTYELLLRWRNGGKGVLLPAWQVGMKRV